MNFAAVNCSAGACTVVNGCEANRGDCDAQSATGCETDLTTTSNCGICGQVCSGSTPHCAPTGPMNEASCVP